MAFTDLAYTKAEAKEEVAEYASPAPRAAEGPSYPWGLCISLEKRELDLLGIKSAPGIGDELHMTVIARVTSVNQEFGPMRDDDQLRVGMQITMADLLMVEPAADEAAEGKQTPAKEDAEQRAMQRPSSVSGYLMKGKG
jgi:hypothetical protein